ncbi:DNA repair protein RecN [Crocinitomix catalasitica]|uniref:DNA repair protein RecN n=1 Tax=Crocinitomix catalasitica TaxID=184607 RepID=UPI000489A40F|nr:DNA repair protein RecN [Crocinitomix catalasitica]
MLRRLEISNFALIENANLNLSNGFTAITGETGAGKSILLKALNLLLGERADNAALSHSDQKCVLEAEFDISKLNLKSFFDEEDLDFDNSCILRREFNTQGKSRAFINDTPVQLQQLKNIGNSLISIHTQHESLSLFTTEFQTEVLDYFAGIQEKVADYKKLYKSYTHDINSLAELSVKEMENRKEKDYLEFLSTELVDAQLNKIDFEELKAKSVKIENATQLKDAMSNAVSILDNDELGPIVGLKQLIDIFDKIKIIDPIYAGLHGRLLSVKIELDDIENELSALNDDDLFTAEEILLINEKMELINTLLYKHNVHTIAELIELENEISEKILNINSIEDSLSDLKERIDKNKKTLTEKALAISKSRKTFAPKLEKAIHSKLGHLAMAEAAIKVDISNTDNLSIYGFDQVTFLVRTNLGGQFSPLKKVASGGELSRLMLSVLSILAEVKNLPTLIFDEIDSGVSGEVAAKIANEFLAMSKHLQVISITHLAQVAGKAENHLHVAKSNSSGKTTSAVRSLDTEQRINVLAQIISGEEITEAARDNAKQLLKTT